MANVVSRLVNSSASTLDLLWSILLSLGGPDVNITRCPTDTLHSMHNLLFSILLALQGGVGSATLNGAGAPNIADGEDGDTYFDSTAKTLYLKDAGVWVLCGTFAKTVTNAAVTFVTPSAGDGTAQLTTP